MDFSRFSPVPPTASIDTPTFITYVPELSAPSLSGAPQCNASPNIQPVSALPFFRPFVSEFIFPDLSTPSPSTQLPGPPSTQLPSPPSTQLSSPPSPPCTQLPSPPCPQLPGPPIPLPTPQLNPLPASGSPIPSPPITSVPPLENSARPSVPFLKVNFVDTGGATSFAQRHPLKDVQIPRFRVCGSKSDAVKLGEAERKLRKAEKASQLQEGVDAIIKLRDHAIKELGDKLDVHEKIIRNIVNAGTHYVKHRRAGAFNALVHKATGEMNGGKSLFFTLGLLALILAYCRSRDRRTLQAQRNPEHRTRWDGQ